MISSRLRLLGAVSLLFFAAPAVMAQTDSQSQTAPAAKSGGSSSSGQKPKTDAAKLPAGGFASEAEARSKCGSSVVWVGSDHFNHYPGSREYGKKPGYFACG